MCLSLVARDWPDAPQRTQHCSPLPLMTMISIMWYRRRYKPNNTLFGISGLVWHGSGLIFPLVGLQRNNCTSKRAFRALKIQMPYLWFSSHVHEWQRKEGAFNCVKSQHPRNFKGKGILRI